MVCKYCLWSPIKHSLSSSDQAPRPTLQKPKKADQGNWPAPEVVKIGTCYFLNPLKTETNPAPLQSDIFSGPSSVRRQRQNPCTPAHGSPKTKTGVLFSPTRSTFSVSTSGPGAPAPGSQRQKNLRVFVVKKSNAPHRHPPANTLNHSPTTKTSCACSLPISIGTYSGFSGNYRIWNSAKSSR